MSQWNAPSKPAPAGWTYMTHPDLPGGDIPLVTEASFKLQRLKGWQRADFTDGQLTLDADAGAEVAGVPPQDTTEGESSDAVQAVDAEPESEAASESHRSSRRTKSKKED